MSTLDLLFSIKDGGSVSANDTEKIDTELARVNASEIPVDQIQNVIDYVNAELLHNKVSGDIKKKLERLLSELNSA